MNGVHELRELDNEPLRICPVCLRKLHYSVTIKVKQTSFDAVARYRYIAKFYSDDLQLVVSHTPAASKVFKGESSWVHGAIEQCLKYNNRIKVDSDLCLWSLHCNRGCNDERYRSED
mmetsp:Transcript_19629/g.45901  ORF Transcript_19629/g.45901 Transcript_19629/m.45901 type:complete len:117 (+) Transcript_19629:979-1329(+)